MSSGGDEMCHGRLYLRNVPLGWTWWDVSQWVQQQGLPQPARIHVHGGGCDMTSVYIHYHCTWNQLAYYCNQLNGHWLTHRATTCQSSVLPPAKRSRVSRLKSMVEQHHEGSCKGRGRTIFLDYHGLHKNAEGKLIRGECPCCTQPWPQCFQCFVSWSWGNRITLSVLF